MSDIVNQDRPGKPDTLFAVVNTALWEAGNLQWRRFSSLRSRILFGHRANGLGIAVVDLHVGDAKKADKIYQGKFNFAGRSVERKRTGIFVEKQGNENWRHELLGFGWLADMQAAGRELSRVQSRALISEWISIGGDTFFARRFSNNFSSEILANRLIAFACHSPFFLKGASQAFCDRFFASVSRQVKLAYSRSYSEPNELKRLHIHIALAYACLAFSGFEPLRKKVFTRLSSELDKQIFGDGGHISRNPQTLRDLLALLVPLRTGLESSQMEVPAPFNHALERMLPALRFFTCPDGGLSVFNGVNDTRPGLVRRILETDNVNGRPLAHAPHSGYARLQQGKSSLMIDVGSTVADTLTSATSNGLFAMEFCDGSSRLVTNCGAIKYGDEHWQSASRSPQANSGVCLARTGVGKQISNKLVKTLFGGPLLLGSVNVETELDTQRQGTLFSARHDGYANRFGICHTRQLFLSANGFDLRGKDMFALDEQGGDIMKNVPFEIRFHLHPSVSATISRDGASAVLMLANKTGWRFNARGAQLRLEESVYLPQDGRIRKTVQLLLAADIPSVRQVQWAFKRIEKRKPAKSTDATGQTMSLL